MSPYGDVGKAGLYSLAELMGIQGYRTPEEQEYSRFLETKPKAPPGVSAGNTDDIWMQGIKARPETAYLGTRGTTALAGTLAGLPFGPGAMTIGGQGGDIVGKVMGGSSRKKAARASAAAAAANKKAAADYAEKLAAWESKRAELEGASKTSLVNYDPTNALRKTPGYQFRYQTGLGAVEGNQASRGMGQSGRALKELEQYGQGFASNEYQNEYSRRLGLSGIGQNAQTALGNISIGQGTNLANLSMRNAANEADYYGTANNALQSGLSNYLTYKARTNQSSYPSTSTPTTGDPQDWQNYMGDG